MTRALLPAFACLAALHGVAWADVAVPADSPMGFNYCPPPVEPRCIDPGLVRHRPMLEACSRDVLRFTQSLGAYRACLSRESERAIGSGNAAIARFRCLTQGGRKCR